MRAWSVGIDERLSVADEAEVRHEPGVEHRVDRLPVVAAALVAAGARASGAMVPDGPAWTCPKPTEAGRSAGRLTSTEQSTRTALKRSIAHVWRRGDGRVTRAPR